jgi:hypothetical protein
MRPILHLLCKEILCSCQSVSQKATCKKFHL